MPAFESEFDIIDIAATVLGAAIGHIVPMSAADTAVVDHMTRAPLALNGDVFFAALQQHGGTPTPGVWSFYLHAFAKLWSEPNAKELAMMLPIYREQQRAAPAAAGDAFLDAAAEAFATLAMLDFDDCTGYREDACAIFHTMAVFVQAAGNEDLAYNLAALALDLGPGTGPAYEQAARFAIALADHAKRLHQIAVCNTALAGAIADAALRAPARRLEAFDACESALERILQTEESIAGMAAQKLASVVSAHAYLRPFLLPLMPYLPDADHARLRRELHIEQWPRRIETFDKRGSEARMQARISAQRWEIEVEKARFALEGPAPGKRLQADWIDWTVDHAAYRRALPHMGSFLREQDFNVNFVELTHEITHVLSLLGGFGQVLACMRAAAFRAEITLCTMLADDTQQIQQHLLTKGLMALPPGHAAALFRAEQGLELTLKARILQDTWTAWFEGLAIFGELSADPAMDPDGIGHVNGCLRNLVDFVPTQAQRASKEAVHLAFEAFQGNFERHCSAAIAELAPDRLRDYLDQDDMPYFSGYLAVRAVISRWRSTTGKPLSATAASNLLLHATRYAIHQGLPDLSLPAAQFEAEARRRMGDWVAALARLDAGEIDAFVKPTARDSRGTIFFWEGMHVRPSDGDRARHDASERALFLKHMKSAMLTLAHHGDETRIDHDDPHLAPLLAACAEGVREQLDTRDGQDALEQQVGVAAHLLQVNSLLPIGRTHTKFFVHRHPDEDYSYLGLNFRTTERARDSGTLSVNEIWLPVSHDDAGHIARISAQSANPRMEAVRLIDISGILLHDLSMEWSHVIALRYDDWNTMHFPNFAVQARMDATPGQRADAMKLIAARLHPTGMLAAEMKIIAHGENGAERTCRGTSAAETWRLEGVDLSAWARHVHRLGNRVLDQTHRTAARRDAGLELLRALHVDARLSDALATGNFGDMTAATGRRRDIIAAFLSTARQPGTDDGIAALAGHLARAELPFFQHGPAGWDIAPAH